MIISIGANLHGFIVGSSLLVSQLILVVFVELFWQQPDIEYKIELDLMLRVVVGSIFALGVIIPLLYWITTILIVLPASYFYRYFSIKRLVGSILGGSFGLMVVWPLFSGLKIDSIMQWQLFIACITVPPITGAVTGYRLSTLTIR